MEGRGTIKDAVGRNGDESNIELIHAYDLQLFGLNGSLWISETSTGPQGKTEP